MKIWIAAILIVVFSLIIARYLKYKGYSFFISFIKSVLALSGISATIWKLL
jgi:hypothetical protein|tara:strand:+ start:1000 stop:1152 length:153 start_codon:yes stop_codon:yes gene_type:complete